MEKVHTAVDAVIVLCGHGSRDPRFKMDFLKFAKSIELCFKSRKTYFCFIEKNNPSIEEMLDITTKNYENIIFVPSLLFRGNHFDLDIKKKIDPYNKKKNIYITENIDIKKYLIKIYKEIIKPKIIKSKTNILINVASSSSNSNIVKSLSIYSKKLSNELGLKKYFFCLLGNENKLFKNLSKIYDNDTNIILHPIFLFNGYLYNNIISKFQMRYSNLQFTRPISHEQKTKEIFKDLINSKLKFFN